LGQNTTTTTTSIGLEFDPPQLTLKDAVLSNQFKVRLNGKPSGTTATVFLNGPGLKFSNCSLEFTQENFAQWKTVSVQGVPVFESMADADSNISARLFTTLETKIDVAYTVKREISPAGVCTSIADPHYVLLDGYAVDHMGKGYFILLDHPHLSVQTFQDIYAGEATVNHAVAVRYGSSIFALDLRNSTTAPNSMSQITPNVDKVVYAAPTAASQLHKLTMPCGSVITVTANSNTQGKWLDITINLVAGYQNTGGFCNQIKSDGKLKARDGTLLARDQINVFANSWVVKPEENLFMAKYTPITPPVVQGLQCSLPTKLEPPVVYLPPAPLPVYVLPPAQNNSKPIAALPTPPEAFLNQIQPYCAKLFQIPGCNDILPPAFYVTACEKDARVTGTFVFAETSRQAYMARCLQRTKFLIDNHRPEDTKKGLDVQKSCGLAKNTCNNNCSQKGTCTDSGCVCNPGFAGIDCSIDMAPLITLNPKTNQYTEKAPVTIYAQPIAYPVKPVVPLPAPIKAPTAPAPQAPAAPAPQAPAPQAPAPESSSLPVAVPPPTVYSTVDAVATATPSPDTNVAPIFSASVGQTVSGVALALTLISMM
jgi:hypothetical protein